ncbi:MAG: prolipoprotein diacylglyceryl transferase [Patescibacteria group bacterium]|jgi:phosphatidylglycerol:prolipoprotein diacylglycerol transferase|nr:prolipoprotein diacylglyceryl transferase [Patescibacteria group bacterium]MDD3939470.1 prolipoprotein diacylglyceryl transferase [Patescibacteria group bacterium]MDD4443547.1 prolipoprotein diacylglyceryl transferase [Patescibacteria group bacterium]
MFNLLHNFFPQPIITTFGPFALRWYGLFVSLGILAALLITLRLGKKYFNFNSEKVIDLSFYLIIFGLIGARLYDVLLFLPYYIDNPSQILKIWQGGLAIHGAIIAGLIVIYFFSKREKMPFFKMTAMLVPGLALGQAIGRFGNYFNQELFGLPTSLPWGIPIEIINRPFDFLNHTHFHPTFLYESLGSFVIFILLIIMIEKINLHKKTSSHLTSSYVVVTATYVILYSILRFFLEFIRLDDTLILFYLRWPQIISLFFIFVAVFILIINIHASKKS